MTDTFVVDALGKPTIVKDDKAVLDYTFDWSPWLNDISDTIANQTVTINSNSGDGCLTVNSSSVNTGNMSVTAWIGNGTIGQKYQVESEITTVDGRTDERSIYITIKDR